MDGGEVQVVDLACGGEIPADILAALEDENVMKWAYNAQFERICLSRFLGFPVGSYLDPSSWHCSMVWAATLGLPMSLENVGTVLGLEKQKLTEGKELIRYFCVPCKLPVARKIAPLINRYCSDEVKTELLSELREMAGGYQALCNMYKEKAEGFPDDSPMKRHWKAQFNKTEILHKRMGRNIDLILGGKTDARKKDA